MKNKKVNRIVTIVAIIVVFVTGLILFSINFTARDNSYSFLEKKWINDNQNSIKNVSVFVDVPVYGMGGTGIIFDYLDDFSNYSGISFNRISYYVNSDKKNISDIAFRVLNCNEEVTDNDILIYKDNYVIIGKNSEYIDDINNIKDIGILSNDVGYLSYYFGTDTNITNYSNYKDLIKDVADEKISYALVPNMLNMGNILSNDTHIVYNMDSVYLKYVLTVNDSTLYSIMKKYYNVYMSKNFQSDYSASFLNVYFNNTGYNDIDRKGYNSRVYNYGYVINMPYENIDNANYVGTISNYLTRFEDLFNVEFNIKRYDTINDLKMALVSGEIDFAISNFNYENLGIENFVTTSIIKPEYVVLSKNNISVNNIKDLRNYTINVIEGSYLNYLCEYNLIKTNTFKDSNELIRNLDNEDIVIMDYSTYVYYKGSKIDNYNVVFSSVQDQGIGFIFNSKFDVLGHLVDYFISSNSYDNFRYNYHTSIKLEKDYTNFEVILICFGIFAVLTISVIIVNNYSKNAMKRDDKLKYIDSLTSLKNRNYLNQNIDKWDDNVIFPQSIIMLDVNELKEINDNQGRKVGDDILVQISNILINNQKENSDIIRSSGDEFLIYLVGYEEKEIKQYINDLSKKIRNVHHCRGCEFGYSMINDEVKIIDDAINEALIMMESNKEKNRESNK